MRGAVLYEPNTALVIEELELPQIGPGHVLVRLVASGVCHSDWHIIKGEWPHIPIPAILGHEGAGIVEAVGPEVRGIAVGDHVVLSWKRNCGQCEMCQRGYPNLCDDVPDERTHAEAQGRRHDAKAAGSRHLQHRDDRAPGRGHPDRQGDSAAAGRADRLRRADRRRRGAQYRPCRGRRLGRRVRLRRRRPELHPGRCDCRRRADHRRRPARQQAGDGKAVRRDPHGERGRGRPGGAHPGADRRQGRALCVRGHRPYRRAFSPEHRVHAQARRDRVRRPCAAPHAGGFRRPHADAGEDGDRLDVRHLPPARRRAPAARPVPRGQAEAGRAGHPHLSARAGQRCVRSTRRGPGSAQRAPNMS